MVQFIDHSEMESVNCTRILKNAQGQDVEVTFDNIGIPNMRGKSLFCARCPEEAAADGEAWEAEKLALIALGFEIIQCENAILIFE